MITQAQMQTIRKLCSQVAKADVTKGELTIGEVRKAMSAVSDILFAESKTGEGSYMALVANGRARAKKKPVKK